MQLRNFSGEGKFFTYSRNMNKTLIQKIRQKSNDYSSQEIVFKDKTNQDLVTEVDTKTDITLCKDSVSVIISCYSGQKTLPLMFDSLERQSYKKFEVVVVDDGSPENMLPVVKKSNPAFKVKFIRETKNKGRSFTRNTGMLASEGNSLIFTDQDIIFDNDFIYRFALRQTYCDNCVLLGFKQDLDVKNLKDTSKADIKSDWRYLVKAEKFFIPLYPSGIRPSEPEREYKILSETNNLKNLGFGKTIGFWDLASTVISHGISMKKELALSSGGFPEEGFDGWGAQDIAFGAKLIGEGGFIVPVLNNVYFHLAHERYSGSREKELKELKQNLQNYFALLEKVEYNTAPKSRKIRKTGNFKNIVIYEVN